MNLSINILRKMIEQPIIFDFENFLRSVKVKIRGNKIKG